MLLLLLPFPDGTYSSQVGTPVTTSEVLLLPIQLGLTPGPALPSQAAMGAPDSCEFQMGRQ